MKKYLCIGIIAGFLAGLAIGIPYGKDQVNQTVFNAGYDSAMNHVSATISKRMAEATPFYIADLGLRFTPRGNSIASIRVIDPSDKGVIESLGHRVIESKDKTVIASRTQRPYRLNDSTTPQPEVAPCK